MNSQNNNSRNRFCAAVCSILFFAVYAYCDASVPKPTLGESNPVVEKITRLAHQGNDTAQYTLGFMYDNGQGVAQNHVIAAQWYQKAAIHGFADAQFKLGGMYYKGRGVKQNYLTAAQWFRKAAIQGDVAAQSTLGSMYVSGKGVKKNDTAAAQWFRKAAVQGDAGSQFMLGTFYEKGQGIAFDIVQAHFWYDVAAQSGNVGAKEARSYVEIKMTPEEIKRAQEMTQKWNEHHQKQPNGVKLK